MNKIDFHTHILPAADDGAKTPEMAAQMLAELQKQGVSTVVFTPHYYSHLEPIETFVKRRAAAVKKLDVSGFGNLSFKIGAEVYFTEYLFNNKDLSMLCIDKTNTMLVELPFHRKIDSHLIGQLDRLVCEYGITPVMAHIERYPDLIRSKRLLQELLYIGCACQVNLSSFTMFGKGHLLSLVKAGYVGALGTDAHNMESRPADYDSGYRYLETKLSVDQLQRLQQSMSDLLK